MQIDHFAEQLSRSAPQSDEGLSVPDLVCHFVNGNDQKRALHFFSAFLTVYAVVCGGYLCKYNRK